VTGQFLSRDPIEALTREPYGYAGDSPTNGTDRTGLASEAEEVCIWPFCGPNPALEEALERSAQEAQEGVEKLWDSIFGGDDSTTQSQPTLTKAEQEYEDEHHECPLERKGWRQDKKVTERELEEAGLDAHELKDEAKGKDIYKDREGNLYVKPQGGNGPGEPLGINIKDHLP
jgi:hypothetical protein